LPITDKEGNFIQRTLIFFSIVPAKSIIPKENLQRAAAAAAAEAPALFRFFQFFALTYLIRYNIAHPKVGVFD
jgi:hypothetical protein